MSKRIATIGGIAILVIVAAVILTRSKAPAVPAPQVSENSSAASAVLAAECTSPPKTLENGRKEYPIAKKYEHLPWLGQLFTADDCGAERLGEVAGGAEAAYPWGSKLFIEDASGARDAVLGEIGYVCRPDSVNDGLSECVLDEAVTVGQLLKLKPYAETIEGDDCVLCG